MKVQYEVWYSGRTYYKQMMGWKYKDDIFDNLEAAKLYIQARRLQNPDREYSITEVTSRDLPFE